MLAFYGLLMGDALPLGLVRDGLELPGQVLVRGEPAVEVIVALTEGSQEETEQAAKRVLGVDLTGRNLRAANFASAILPKANLREATLTTADLRWVTLTNTQISKAVLDRADLRSAALSGADLAGADLTGADLSPSSFWTIVPADFPIGDTSADQFIQLYKRLPELVDMYVDKPAYLRSLARSFVSGEASLSGADLTGADLSAATLIKANLFNATLTEVDLSGADLRNAILYGARLEGADLRRATLSSAILSRATLSGAQLNGAFLDKADLRRARLSGADLSGASFDSATKLDGACGAGALLPEPYSVLPCPDELVPVGR